MGLKDSFSNYVMNKAEKRMKQNESMGGSVRFASVFADEDNILESSDVYELIQDISNQVMLAEIVVVGEDGKEIEGDSALKVLNDPNEYLTRSEFLKLMTNTYLLQGEVFPFLDRGRMHLVSNVETKLDKQLQPEFKVNGVEIPPMHIRHVKNIGTNHLKGVGILGLGRRTLEGVMNAEKTLTDKYIKGGLLAFLLKLDAHINPANNTQSVLVKRILDQLEQIDDSRSVKMIPLGKGYEIESMTSPIDDQKTLDYLNVYKKDLGKYLSMNVDTYTALLKKDLEMAMMYLHNKSVRPIMKNFEEHLTILFFGRNSKKHIQFKIDILEFVPYSIRTNIAYNVVRTGITSPNIVAEKFLGLPTRDTPESDAIYISNDLTEIGKKNATDDSLKGGENKDEQKGATDV